MSRQFDAGILEKNKVARDKTERFLYFHLSGVVAAHGAGSGCWK